MKKCIILSFLLFTACATHDQYQPHTSKTEKDWSDCYSAAHVNFQNGRNSGSEYAGSNPRDHMIEYADEPIRRDNTDGPKWENSDIQPFINKCMASKGYNISMPKTWP